MKWFLYHLDNQNVDKNLHGLIVDKVDLEPHHENWVNNKDKAIFPKMKKGDSLIATQHDMPIGVFNWETTLYCRKCEKYHYKYEEC
jgi:hypothetical protein